MNDGPIKISALARILLEDSSSLKYQCKPEDKQSVSSRLTSSKLHILFRKIFRNNKNHQSDMTECKTTFRKLLISNANLIELIIPKVCRNYHLNFPPKILI